MSPELTPLRWGVPEGGTQFPLRSDQGGSVAASTKLAWLCTCG